jgi:hypothetical protein
VPSHADLGFSVASQLKTDLQVETMLNIGGVFASFFVGDSAEYMQGSPSFQPRIVTEFPPPAIVFCVTFTSFPFDDPSNGAPGNGTFPTTRWHLRYDKRRYVRHNQIGYNYRSARSRTRFTGAACDRGGLPDWRHGPVAARHRS